MLTSLRAVRSLARPC